MPAKKTLSLLLALAFLLLLIIWMATGAVLSSREEAPASDPVEPSSPFRVETRWLEAQPFTPQLVLQGQFHPEQQLDIKAETSGRVERLQVQEGTQVEQGQPLLQLSQDTRPARLAQLRAERDSRQAEVNAAERLRSANHLSETEYLRLKSSLLQIKADLEAAELDLQHTQPQAPFSGYLEELVVEEGDWVQAGQTLARLIQTRTLKAEARVPQQRIHKVSLGQEVTLVLLDGEELQGKISFISQQADPGTRSFRIQAKVDNVEQRRLAGASTTLRVQLQPTTAHYLSAALLSLDEAGRLIVKQVKENQRVEAVPITLLSSDASGAWVSGLPARAQVITLGGGFVQAGEAVTPVVTGQQAKD